MNHTGDDKWGYNAAYLGRGWKPDEFMVGVGNHDPQPLRQIACGIKEEKRIFNKEEGKYITAYEDKSFEFVLKTTPASNLLLKAAGIKSGSGNPKTTKVGKISVEKLREIAEYKMPDLNANDVEAAMRIVAGTARNMGITIEGWE